MADVVGAIRDGYRQAVSVIISAHQMVAGRFAGRIRAARIVRAVFGPLYFGIKRQRAQDFVSRHVVEMFDLMLVRGFKQLMGAQHISADKIVRRGYRTVNMGFSGKMNNGFRLLFSKYFFYLLFMC